MPREIYRALYRIRRVEEEIARLYPTDCIKSPVHLSIGQEAVSVGVCLGLAPDDVAFGTYRSHALYLAKGGDLRGMIAELYGKATGCAKGKGGSMHLIDVAAGMMGTSAVVGTTIPLAVGYAWACKLRRARTVVASVFGDGAAEEGVFHESLNFAALMKVPVLFVCENNLYAIHTPQRARQATADVCRLARAHGIPAVRVEDGSVFRILDATRRAVAAMRAGGGPQFIECVTYRWKEHVGPAEDFHIGYRPRSEAEPWFADDPVRGAGEQLAPADRERIEGEVEVEIRDAFAFAEASPFPEADALYTDVVKEGRNAAAPDLC